MAEFDVLIRNGRVVDGTGSPWFHADVALQGERIAAIAPPGSIPEAQCGEVVDATGKVVCPGFIDILSHSILSLMVDGRSLSKITQGVTTEIMGEGWTPAPFGGQIQEPVKHSLFAQQVGEWKERMREWTRFRDWLDAMMEHGVSPNIGAFLGGGTLRMYAMGMAMGEPSEEALETMRRVAREAMEDGALGVSFALIYPPSAYTTTRELVEIARVIREHHGLYITHIRSEADQFLEALEEAITVGREAQVPVEIYHLKAAGRRNWWKLPGAIARIHQARAEGVDITADIYPYTAAGTALASVLPPWAAADDKFFENVQDPEMRAKIKAEALNPSGDWEALVDLCGPEGVMPIGFEKEENRPYIGKRLSEIAALRGQDWPDAVMDLFASEGQRISTIYFMMSEHNLRLKLQQPWITVGTDAGGFDPAWAEPLGPYHPRAYGSFPRILGRYVREERIIPLEDAIRKFSGAAAARLGIRDRGLLREGLYADVVVFDPETIRDRATYERPHQLSEGVLEVWINGVRVLRNGDHTGATPGKVVTR